MDAGAAGELIFHPANPQRDTFMSIAAALNALIIFHIKVIVLN